MISRRWQQGQIVSGLSSKKWKEALEGYLFISPWLLGLILLQLGPMLLSLYISFFDWDFFRTPRFIGVRNYTWLFQNDLFWTSLRNTGTYVVGQVSLVTMSAFTIAVLLNQKIPFRNFLRTAYYLPSVTPSIAMLMLWVMLFETDWGLINLALGVVGISPGPNWLGSSQWAMPALILTTIWGLGGAMIIYLAGLQGVPESLYEAADLDGANIIQKVWNVTLPLITPVIFFNLVMGVIGSFQVFNSAYIMTGGGPGYATFVYVLYLYRQAFMFFRMGRGTAMAWLLLLILLTFSYIMFKRSSWVYYEAS